MAFFFAAPASSSPKGADMTMSKMHNATYETIDGAFRFTFRKRSYGWLVIEETNDDDEVVTGIESPEEHLDALTSSYGALRQLA